jgi:hypothetical protein
MPRLTFSATHLRAPGAISPGHTRKTAASGEREPAMARSAIGFSPAKSSEPYPATESERP